MATTNDGIDLLKAEIEKEEALLAQETSQLQEMEKNAKRAESERKRLMKNVSLRDISDYLHILIFLKEHPVLRTLNDGPQEKSQGQAGFTIATEKEPRTMFDQVCLPLPVV